MAHVAASRALAAATRDRPVNRVAHVAASRALAAYHSVHALRCSWDEHVAASRALAAHEQNLAVPQYSVKRSSRTFRTWCGRLWASQLFIAVLSRDQKPMARRKLCPISFDKNLGVQAEAQDSFRLLDFTPSQLTLYSIPRGLVKMVERYHQ